MQPEFARLANEVIDSDPSCHLAMLLLSTCEQVAAKLDAHDREIIGIAMRAAAIDLVGDGLARSSRWH
jgi:hypothetical protein